jgi:PAS domain S-box-containing protein
MKTSIKNKLFIGFTLAVSFVVFFSIVTFINMKDLKQDNKEQFQSFIILKDIEVLFASIIEIESNGRGYAITGKKSFLDYYNANLDQIIKKIKILNQLTNNRRLSELEAQRIRDLLRQKIDFVALVIAIRNDYGEREALNIIRSEKGKILTSKIRSALKSIEERERIEIYKKNELQIKTANFTIFIFTILCLIIISILGLVYYYFALDQKESKIAEAKLLEAKDQLQSILDNTSSLVFIKDLEGKFLFVNRPFEKKVKLTSPFILGNTDYDFYPKEDADKYHESDVITITKKELVEFDGVIMEHDGPTYYNTIKFPLYDNTNKIYGICGITTDVTKKREIEENLKATKDQLQAILDNTNSLVAIRSLNGTFLFVNREYEKLFHSSVGDLLGKSLFDFFPKETADEIFKHDLEVIKTRQLGEYEIDFPVDDEIHTTITSKFPLFDSNNEIYGVCAVSTDITERRKSEEKLKKAYILQNAILNGTDYSIIATNEVGKIIEFNKASEDMLGYKSNEVIHKKTPALFFEPSLLKENGVLEEFSKQPVLVPSSMLDKPNFLETSYLAKNGTIIPVFLSISALRDVNNNVTGFLGIARNITEQRKSERKLFESQQLFQRMSQNVPGIIFQYRLSPNLERKFTYVSSGIRELFEMEPQALMEDSERLWSLLSKEDIEAFFNALKLSAKTMQSLTYEAKINLKSSKTKWIKSKARPEKKENGDILWDGVIVDITEQKIIEQELQQSKERFELSVQGANDGLWDWNLVNNEVYFSARWKGMLGYQDHEIPNSMDSFTKLLHPDTIKSVFELVDQYIAGNVKSYEIELQLLHKRGYYHWVLARGAVLRDATGKAIRFSGSHTDIMERKFQDDALRSSEAKFRAMNDASPLGVFVTDTLGDCIYTNKAFQLITGYSNEQLIGIGWLNAVHPEDNQKTIEHWNKCLSSYQKFESLHRYIQPNGTVVWTSVKTAAMINNGKFIGFVGTVDDLTQMKKAEEKIIQSAYMINNATDAIITSDLNWLITNYNGAAQKIYGFEADEVVGKVAEDVLITEFMNCTKRDFLLALKHKGYWNGEVLQKKKNGELIPILSSLSVNRDDFGNAIGYLAVNRDISDRKKREEIISKLNIDLEQNLIELENSNKELESFSYTISHDLRAPLRAIDGFTSILKEDYIDKLDDEAKRLMNVVMSNAQKMGQLIDDLLHFSRLSKQELVKTKVSMNSIVNKIMFEINAENHEEVSEIIIHTLPDANADESTIKQVWVNLITNAIKYSKTKERPRIEIGCKAGDNETIYYIKDNGVGFNMRYYDKLFGVFQRLHSGEFEGTGVGLAIVHRVVQKHGGKVWAEAEVNNGATFFFSLPI